MNELPAQSASQQVSQSASHNADIDETSHGDVFCLLRYFLLRPSHSTFKCLSRRLSITQLLGTMKSRIKLSGGWMDVYDTGEQSLLLMINKSAYGWRWLAVVGGGRRWSAVVLGIIFYLYLCTELRVVSRRWNSPS